MLHSKFPCSDFKSVRLIEKENRELVRLEKLQEKTFQDSLSNISVLFRHLDRNMIEWSNDLTGDDHVVKNIFFGFSSQSIDAIEEFDVSEQWKTSVNSHSNNRFKRLMTHTTENSRYECSFADIGYTKFKIIRKNLYPSHIKRLKEYDANDVQLCNCHSNTGCDRNCTNRLLLMECSRKYCQAVKISSNVVTVPDIDGGNQHLSLDSCGNTVIQDCSFPLVQVFKTSNCGFGLKLLECVQESSILIEYTGEVITSNECHRRMKKYKPTDDFYFAALDRGLVIDAKEFGSLARFANHSCNPTCELQKWNVNGECRIVLVASKSLNVNEEITYNYKYFDDGLDNILKINRQNCLCGAMNCSGMIGGRVYDSVLDKWIKKATVLLESVSKRPFNIFEEHYNKLQDIKKNPAEVVDTFYNEIIEKFVSTISQAQVAHAKLEKCFHKSEYFSLSIDDARELMLQIPSCIRFEEAVKLQHLIEKSLALDDMIEKLLNNVDGHDLDSDTAIFPWSNIEFCFENLFKCLPIQCEKADKLFILCERISIWCESWRWKWIPRGHVEYDGLKCNIWLYIDTVSKCYNRSHSVTAMLFAWDFLLKTVRLYSARFQKRSINADSNHISNSDSYSSDHNGLAVSNIHSKSENVHEIVFYCHCGLPDECESGLSLLECDICERWFHPDCENIMQTSLHKSSFVCALCLYDQGRTNSLLTYPLFEWKDNVLKSNEENGSCFNDESKGKKKYIDRRLVSRSSSTKKKDIGITFEELKSFLLSGEMLKCSENPLMLLLMEIQTIVLAWQCRVSEECFNIKSVTRLMTLVTNCTTIATEASSEGSMLNITLNTSTKIRQTTSDLSYCSMNLMSLILEYLRDYGTTSNFLEVLLVFYYDLRILRIRCKEIKFLRKLIWIINVLKSIIRCPNQQYVNMPLPKDITLCYQTGIKFGLDRKSVLMRYIKKVEDDILEFKSWTYPVNSNIDSCRLLSIATYISSVCDMTSEYIMTRVKAFALKYQLPISELKWNTEIILPTNETVKDVGCQLYCVCQSVDDGSHMICCDNCEVWFHWRCVGIKSKRHLNSTLPIKNFGSQLKLNTYESTNDDICSSNILDIENVVRNHDKSMSSMTDSGQYLCICCSEESGKEYPFKWM